MEEFDIYISGFLPERADDAAAGLVRAFGLDPRRAHELVQSLPRVVKRHVSGEQVERYVGVLRELGALFELRRSAIRPAQVIAVQGGEPEAAPSLDPELHGSTLTLPLPSVFEKPAREAPASQFAQTIVERGLPASLVAEIAEAEARAAAAAAAAPTPAWHAERSPPASVAPPMPPIETTSWESVPVRPRSSRPPASSGTLREGSPSLLAAQRPAPVPADPLWPVQRDVLSAPPAPARHPPPQAPPIPVVPASLAMASRPPPPSLVPPGPDALPPLAAGWLTPEPFKRPAPLSPPSGEVAPFAPALELEDIDVGGRPGWLLDAAELNRQGGSMHAPPGSAPGLLPELEPRPSRTPRRAPSAPAPSLDLDESAWSRPRGGQPSAAPGPRAGGEIGYAFGQPAAEPPPLALRLLLRFGLGVSLFVCISAVRHAMDSDISHAIAAWADAPADAPADTHYAPKPSAAKAPHGERGYGPPALQWMESDLHYFSNPDKDAVRARVKAFRAAGAIEVYVGNIMRSGPMSIANELIIELPEDKALRRAIMDEYENGMRSTFGGFAPRASVPTGPVLRVTL